MRAVHTLTLDALEVVRVPLHLIDESKHNPRKYFDPRNLQELADDIGIHGVRQPGTVRLNLDGRYELGAGHRRFRASKLAGLEDMPVFVREMDDAEFIKFVHTDNNHREDLDAMDEALGFSALIDQHGWDVVSLAAEIGRPLEYVARRLRLLKLVPAAQEAVRRKFLPVMHAEVIARLPNSTQASVLRSEFNLNTERLALAAAGETLPSVVPEDDDSYTDADTFEEVAVVDEFALHTYDPIVVPTLAGLNAALKRDQYRRLALAPWALDDAELLPAAGACVACQKRSGCNPSLFEELDPTADACLDAECFEAKHDALTQRENVARQSAEAPRSRKATPTVRAEEIDSHAEEQKKAREAKKRAVERARRGRAAVATAVASAVTEWHFLSIEFLREVFLSLLVEQYNDEPFRHLLEFCGLSSERPEQAKYHWQAERLAEWSRSLTPDQEFKLFQAVAFALVMSETHVEDYQLDRKPKRLDAFAELLKIPARAVAAEAAKAKPSPTVTPIDKPKRARGRKGKQAATA